MRDRDHEPAPSVDLPPARTSSNPSQLASTHGILDRGRPQIPRQSDMHTQAQHHQRPSSFFGLDADAQGADAQDSPLGGAPPPSAPAVGGSSQRGEYDSAKGPSNGRANSFFGVEAPREAPAADPASTATPAAAPRNNAPSSVQQADGHPARRSSFYGLDAPRPSAVPAGVVAASASREGSSPGRDTPSTASHHNQSSGSGSGSGSGSYSSDVHGGAAHPHPRARYSHAPYAASRSASLYGGVSSSNDMEGGVPPPPPAQLLDQSHLRVGTMASLLSHDKTLELYRQNAKKTNDPDIQYEFATFTMDVVADLEQSTIMARVARGEDAPPLPQEVEARQKQQALVAESISLLNRLATRGHVPSCYFLADCYTQGIGTTKVRSDSLALARVFSPFGAARSRPDRTHTGQA